MPHLRGHLTRVAWPIPSMRVRSNALDRFRVERALIASEAIGRCVLARKIAYLLNVKAA